MGLGSLRRVIGLRSVFSSAVLAAAAGTGWVLWPVPPVPEDIGDADRFEGKLLLEPMDGPDSVMRLGADFAYVDADGKRWVAEAGSETDGASIPRVLYTFVGQPFDGTYLKAAIIHDAYCPSEGETWRDVHRVFYRALRRCGVGEKKAKVMYAAVYHFGPRWPEPGSGRTVEEEYADSIVKKRLTAEATATGRPEVTRGTAPPEAYYDTYERGIALTQVGGEMLPAAGDGDEQFDEVRGELFEKCRKWIEREDPSLEKIEDWTAGMGETK